MEAADMNSGTLPYALQTAIFVIHDYTYCNMVLIQLINHYQHNNTLGTNVPYVIWKIPYIDVFFSVNIGSFPI